MSEDWIDGFNFGGPATVAVVEDNDYFEVDSMTEILELGCSRSDDSKDSECFTSDNNEDLVCSSPSGSEYSWIEMFDFFFSLAMRKIFSEARVILL